MSKELVRNAIEEAEEMVGLWQEPDERYDNQLTELMRSFMQGYKHGLIIALHLIEKGKEE